MAGFPTAYAQTLLDYAFPTSGSTDHIAYSANGTSETGSLARTAVGATGWAAATAADPSVKANNALLTSAAASAGVTVTHFAIYSASTAGTSERAGTYATSAPARRAAATTSSLVTPSMGCSRAA